MNDNQPQADGQPAAGATTGDATGAPPGQNGGEHNEQPKPAVAFATEEEFQQRVEAMLKERLDRANKKADEQARKAKEQAEQEAAAKNGEWQKLAEQRGTKLGELETANATLTSQVETLTSQASRLDKALRTQLDGLRKDVPKPVMALLDKLDPVEQLAWLAANRDQVGPGKQGVPGTPKPAGNLDAADREAARKQAAAMYAEL
jgi:hypothetical protein